jgi:hypothetical protein
MQNKRCFCRGLAAGIIAGILVLSGCADVVQGPQEEALSAGGAGPGIYPEGSEGVI